MYASINLFIYGKTYFVKRTTIYPDTAVFRIIVNSTGFEPASPQTLLFKNSTLKSSYESNVSLVAQTFLSGYSLKYHRQECLCHKNYITKNYMMLERKNFFWNLNFF